ncbi:MAG: NAD-dependent epimerase/dehydratase family protein [Ignavibacteria bacterium]|nr:NAD-dependent epimerase/dehydratase family protein [Ignavibacteria bacterium]
MKILVTGGAGFIGSHIVDAYINLGYDVTIVDNLSTGSQKNLNSKARFIKMDINDSIIEELICDEKFDIINHHAAQIDVRISVENPFFDAQTNILASLRIYESAKKSNVKKIIFASSGGTVYGEQIYFPADENHPLLPCSPYGISKLANEKYLFYYKTIHNLDYVALRYSNVYGPRQNPYGEAGVVAIFTKKFLIGEQPIINGDGFNTRDYVYISDVVRANVLALKENVNGSFNIGTGKEHDVNYIFQKLKEITGSNLPKIHGPAKPGEQRRNSLSYEKFYLATGWKPEIDFDEGLKKTVEFFKNNPDF